MTRTLWIEFPDIVDRICYITFIERLVCNFLWGGGAFFVKPSVLQEPLFWKGLGPCSRLAEIIFKIQSFVSVVLASHHTPHQWRRIGVIGFLTMKVFFLSPPRRGLLPMNVVSLSIWFLIHCTSSASWNPKRSREALAHSLGSLFLLLQKFLILNLRVCFCLKATYFASSVVSASLSSLVLSN